MDSLALLSRAFFRFAIAAAMFTAVASPCCADSADQRPLDPTQKAKLIEKWTVSSDKFAAVMISGTYQRQRMTKDGKLVVDEDAVFTLFQEMNAPYRKRLTLSPERHFTSDGFIAWERQMFSSPERSVVVTTANGSEKGVYKTKMVEICEPYSTTAERNLYGLSLVYFLPNIKPGVSRQYPRITAHDLQDVKIENNGNIQIAFPDSDRVFWKILSPDGMGVVGYVSDNPPSKEGVALWCDYADASGEIAVGEFHFPKSLRLWRRFQEDWSLYSYTITRFEIKTEVQDEDFTPHFETGYSLYDARTGVRFVTGDTPENMIKDIEKSLREKKQ